MSVGTLEVVDDQAFQSRVLNNTRPALVLFTSPTCPPCKILARCLPDLARQFSDGVDIVRCPIEASPRTARAYQITQTPTLALFDGGAAIASHVGLWSLPAIRAWVHASLRRGRQPSRPGPRTSERGSKMMVSRELLRTFFSPAIALQACRVASVVAPALLLLNHADLLLRHPLSLAVGQKLALNFLVPYLVSSYFAARTAATQLAITPGVS
jgi:thioredoxin 1